MSTPNLKSALAIKLASKNNEQIKLVKDIPSMINCLAILVDRRIAKNSKTQDMLVNFAEKYLEYGRLHDNSIPVLRSVILQYSTEILKVMNEVPSEVLTGREPGDESENEDSEVESHNSHTPF